MKTSTCQCLANGIDGLKKTRGGAPKGARRAGTPTYHQLLEVVLVGGRGGVGGVTYQVSPRVMPLR